MTRKLVKVFVWRDESGMRVIHVFPAPANLHKVVVFQQIFEQCAGMMMDMH